MKRMKYATYRCLGAGCDRQVRLRVGAKRGPKSKPPQWKMVWARAQDGDPATLREAALLFCSQRCLDMPAASGALAAKTHAYLGEAGEPPVTVIYRCLTPGCEQMALLANPVHRPQKPEVPEGWEAIPLIAIDYESGVQRVTTLTVCSEECLDRLDPDAAREDLPEIVQVELARVLAGMHVSEEDQLIVA